MQTFNIDIAQSPAPLVLYAKQGDSLSRFFQINFLESGQPWTPPAGAHFAVRYGTPGLPSGWYDTIQEPDGGSHSAFGLLGNALTVEIAYEAVSASGRNSLCVLVLDSNGYQLGAWNLALQVEITPGENAPESTQYYSLLSAQVAQVLASVTDAENAATLSKSWAVGGTGTREGEDTNNAEYWAGQAAASAGQSLGFRTFSAAVSPDPTTGDVDPTSPMLMANLTATSAADRLDHVVVPGKTTQAGSGDPSPANIRELSGVGRKMVKREILTGDGFSFSESSESGNIFRLALSPAAIYDSSAIAVYCNRVFVPVSYNDRTQNVNIFRACVEVGVTLMLRPSVQNNWTLEELKNNIKKWAAEGNPLTIWYLPADESQATGWYTYAAVDGDTYAAVDGDTYAAVGMELDGPLFDGDSVSNNAETLSGRQCAVYRQKVLYTLTGQENYQTFDIWSPGSVVIYGYLVGAVRVSEYDTVANIQCSHLVTKSSNSITTNGVQGCGQANGTALFLNFGSPYNTLESAKAYIQQQYADGTPVQILATLATPTTTYSTAQPLANPAGTWTLSAENTPQGYMRALSDADRADYADTAGTANQANNADQLAGQPPAWYMPPGLMAPFAGSTAPAGWLLCDGSAVSRTTYAALFAVIGTTYGAGDGNTTFALPNLQGRVAAGTSSSHPLASKAGADSKQIARANLPAEKLNLEDDGTWIVDSVQTGSESGKTLQMGTRSGAARLETNTLGSGTAFDVRQATLYLNYIIKY